MNPLISLLSGLTGGGSQQSQSQPQQKPAPQQGGGQGNPLMELLSAMVSGQNAMNALTNVLPHAAQLLNNRGGQSMENFVRNEYQNHGVDINAAMQQLQEMMGSMNNNNNNYSGGQNNNANNNYGGQNTYNGGQGGYNAQGGNTNNTNNIM